MHVTPAFSVFAGEEEACTRRSSSTSTNSSGPRIAARADRSTASAVILAAGGSTARLLAEAGSCLASSFAWAKAEAIGSELLRRPRGRAAQARQSSNVCLSLSPCLRVHHKILQKKQKNRKTEHSSGTTFSEKFGGQGPTNRSTYQR